MKELKGRKFVLLFGIPFGIICVLLGNPYFAIVSIIVMIIGIDEFYHLSIAKGANPNRNFGFIMTTFVSLIYYLELNISGNVFFGFLCIFVIMGFLKELSQDKDNALINIAATFMGILYVPVLLGTVIALREFDSGHGSNIVLALLISIWACDSAAFFCGTWWGKSKIFPRVSPKKTWVGSIAGFLASVLVFGIFHTIGLLGVHLELIAALILGAISGFFGQVGDFTESLMKRDAGVKDSGSILKAHGGILDRFDSLIFAAPMIYFCVHFLAEI